MQYISLERIQKYICNWVRIVKHVNDINTSLRLSKKKKRKIRILCFSNWSPIMKGVLKSSWPHPLLKIWSNIQTSDFLQCLFDRTINFFRPLLLGFILGFLIYFESYFLRKYVYSCLKYFLNSLGPTSPVP